MICLLMGKKTHRHTGVPSNDRPAERLGKPLTQKAICVTHFAYRLSILHPGIVWIKRWQAGANWKSGRFLKVLGGILPHGELSGTHVLPVRAMKKEN
ncbi:hypothetical protein NFO65_19650 [Neorhizobium galegae]|uniref:hypothetical protein n=1 Tax=Neorhizobium galegae TaxID=399 RepID=UPI0021011CDE|nr:hypothetical protein [Neorhizobium galegae]MCQ1572944.1 hypothetical protein [Neorhizobium galegae]